MTSKIKLYAIPQLTYDKSFAFDSITALLGNYTPIELSNFQYIKHGLNVEIKVNVDQLWIDISNNYNYLSIQNGDEKIRYYFIQSKEWRSESTILLRLRMDVLNTYSVNVDYQFSNRTKIKRQHKDRFKIINDFIEGYNNPHDNAEVVEVIEDYRRIALFDLVGFEEALGDTLILEKDDEPNIKVEWYDKNTKKLSSITANSVNMLTLMRVSNGVTLYGQNHDGDEMYNQTFSDEWIRDNYLALSLYDGNSTYISANGDDFANVYAGAIEKKIYRNIDFESEGINPTLKRKDVIELSDDGRDWFLAYRSQTESETSQPIDCILTANEQFEIKFINDGTFTESALVGGTRYVFLHTDANENASIKLFDINDNLISEIIPNDRYYYKNNVSFMSKSDDVIQVNRWGYDSSDIAPLTIGVSPSVSKDCAKVVVSGYSKFYQVTQSVTYQTTLAKIRTYPSQTFGEVTQTGEAINSLNRSDPKLSKVIMLPYCPVDFNDGKLTGDWKFDTTLKMPVLQDLNSKFQKVVQTDFNPLDELIMDKSIMTTTSDKNPFFESKLLHSDFHYTKMVYDSFGYVFALENVDIGSYYGDFNINFIMTTTMNSRFAFQFTGYQLRYSSEDYDKLMIVSRNNEITLYSSAYLNYIKNGYNYDVKAKERQLALSVWGATSQIAGTIGALATGNPFGVPMATSSISSIVSVVSTAINGEDSMRRRLQELKNQSTSVSGSDDVDLMKAYTNNKAKIVQYDCSDNMKKSLFDLFFYAGYRCEYNGIPSVFTRIHFDFLACEPVFESNLNNFTEEIRMELSEKYINGVTFMHLYNNSYDINQSKENWERSIVNEL